MSHWASLQRVVSVTPITGATQLVAIDVEPVQKKCLVKVGLFHVGDFCVFLKPGAQFTTSLSGELALIKPLRTQIKPRRFCGVMSEGIALNISFFPDLVATEALLGADISAQVGVASHEKIMESRAKPPRPRFPQVARAQQLLASYSLPARLIELGPFPIDVVNIIFSYCTLKTAGKAGLTARGAMAAAMSVPRHITLFGDNQETLLIRLIFACLNHFPFEHKKNIWGWITSLRKDLKLPILEQFKPEQFPITAAACLPSAVRSIKVAKSSSLRKSVDKEILKELFTCVGAVFPNVTTFETNLNEFEGEYEVLLPAVSRWRNLRSFVYQWHTGWSSSMQHDVRAATEVFSHLAQNSALERLEFRVLTPDVAKLTNLSFLKSGIISKEFDFEWLAPLTQLKEINLSPGRGAALPKTDPWNAKNFNESISKLHNLETLIVPKIGAKMLVGLERLPRLSELDIFDATMNESVAVTLSRMSALTKLNLGCTEMTPELLNQIFAGLATFAQLRSLKLDGYRKNSTWGKEVFTNLSQITSLIELDVHHPQITAEAFAPLAAAQNLKKLSMYCPKLRRIEVEALLPGVTVLH